LTISKISRRRTFPGMYQDGQILSKGTITLIGQDPSLVFPKGGRSEQIKRCRHFSIINLIRNSIFIKRDTTVMREHDLDQVNSFTIVRIAMFAIISPHNSRREEVRSKEVCLIGERSDSGKRWHDEMNF